MIAAWTPKAGRDPQICVAGANTWPTNVPKRVCIGIWRSSGRAGNATSCSRWQTRKGVTSSIG